MTQEVQNKFDKLSLEKQRKVEDLIELLATINDSETDDSISVAELRKRNMGWAKGKIWMADDFNDTPEEFKDYM